MPHLFAPLLGANPLTISPATGSWTAARAPTFSHGHSPFQQLFIDQLRWLQGMGQPSSPAPLAVPAMPAIPRQGFAASGEASPFAFERSSPMPGITLESFTYTRITLGNAGPMQPTIGGANVDPRAYLAEMFAGLGAPLPEAAVDDDAPMPPEAARAGDAAATEVAQKAQMEPDLLADSAQLGDKIGRSVAKISASGVPNAEFAVDHPRYGRIEAGVEISGGAATLTFAVEDPTLRATLESVRGNIESALTENGLSLAAYRVGTPGAPQDTPRPVSAEELVASAYQSQLDAALSRIISDMALADG